MRYRCLSANSSRKKLRTALRTLSGGVPGGMENMTLCASLGRFADIARRSDLVRCSSKARSQSSRRSSDSLARQHLAVVGFKIDLTLSANVVHVPLDRRYQGLLVSSEATASSLLSQWPMAAGSPDVSILSPPYSGCFQ